MSRQSSFSTILLFAGLFALAGAVFFVLPEMVVKPKIVEVKPAPPAEPSPEPIAEVASSEPEPVNEPSPEVEAQPEPAPVAPPPPPPAASPAPASPDPVEAAQPVEDPAMIEIRERVATIQRHMEAAQQAESEENWSVAVEEWAAVLAIDSTVEQARREHFRVAELADLEQGLAVHLANPGRLSAGAVLAEARRLIGRAASQDTGSKIALQAEQLAVLTERWSQPVTVELRSDGATDVAVYHVGALGAFEARSLELRPGTYTVTGKRSGYRDVRAKLVVAPGEVPEPMTIRCTEKI